MTSAPGPSTLNFNKQLFSSDLFSVSSFANTTKQPTSTDPTSIEVPTYLDKAWIQPTSTVCTQLIHSVQPYFLKHQVSASPAWYGPGPVPSLPNPHGSPPPEDTHSQGCQSPFDEEKLLLCDICKLVDGLPPPPHLTLTLILHRLALGKKRRKIPRITFQ